MNFNISEAKHGSTSFSSVKIIWILFAQNKRRICRNH